MLAGWSFLLHLPPPNECFKFAKWHGGTDGTGGAPSGDGREDGGGGGGEIPAQNPSRDQSSSVSNDASFFFALKAINRKTSGVPSCVSVRSYEESFKMLKNRFPLGQHGNPKGSEAGKESLTLLTFFLPNQLESSTLVTVAIGHPPCPPQRSQHILQQSLPFL